jgi:hypothetical protein
MLFNLVNVVVVLLFWKEKEFVAVTKRFHQVNVVVTQLFYQTIESVATVKLCYQVNAVKIHCQVVENSLI